MIRRATWACWAAVALLAVSARPALAGRPLLCHPFDIGAAPSLPWDGATSWFDRTDDYDLARLVADTESLLTPTTPVVARMETLRRAAIYASADPELAARLVRALTARLARTRGADGDVALAYLDAAYLVEALRQIARIGNTRDLRVQPDALRAAIANLDGYAMMRKGLALRPDDPALAFAAALIVADRNREAFLAHAKVARDGASRDALLARNIKHVSY